VAPSDYTRAIFGRLSCAPPERPDARTIPCGTSPIPAPLVLNPHPCSPAVIGTIALPCIQPAASLRQHRATRCPAFNISLAHLLAWSSFTHSVAALAVFVVRHSDGNSLALASQCAQWGATVPAVIHFALAASAPAAPLSATPIRPPPQANQPRWKHSYRQPLLPAAARASYARPQLALTSAGRDTSVLHHNSDISI